MSVISRRLQSRAFSEQRTAGCAPRNWRSCARMPSAFHCCCAPVNPQAYCTCCTCTPLESALAPTYGVHRQSQVQQSPTAVSQSQQSHSLSHPLSAASPATSVRFKSKTPRVPEQPPEILSHPLGSRLGGHSDPPQRITTDLPSHKQRSVTQPFCISNNPLYPTGSATPPSRLLAVF